MPLDLPRPLPVMAAAKAVMAGRAGCFLVRARGDGPWMVVLGEAHARAAHPLGSLAKIPLLLASTRSPTGLSWVCAGPGGKPPCWTRHGLVDAEHMLAHSCGTAAARHGEALGRPLLLASLARAGFGRKTQSLPGDEETGHVPRMASAGQLASGRAWQLTGTPLQVAVLMQRLAGQDAGPQNPATAVTLAGLRLGVREGTAAGLDQVGFLAGKTGTALDGRGGRDGWFAGWTRQWVVVAWLRGGTGYGTARTVVRAWARAARIGGARP
ncbi:MAG: penicillin-binding transpeptidase domain-containing protein [Candidatus Sericytochromatia bacterium]|nr:penicillin-binding transpeptidase domain-containing protein [Candidatus Sericytochromatia bacterium]